MGNFLNFKSYFKFLGRNKVFTAINIFGLSASLMFVILIMVYAGQGLATDRFQKNADRIYAIGSEQGMGFAWRIGERLTEQFPEIEKMCPLVTYPDDLAFVDEHKYGAALLFTDTTFFDMFSFPLLQGDPKTALATKNDAVISESFARKVFGERDPMGQFIRIKDSVTVMVSGVVKDMKNSAIPYSDILIKIDNVRFWGNGHELPGGENAAGVQVFFQAVVGADLQAKSEDMVTFLKKTFWIYERKMFNEVRFTPLKRIYFSDENVLNSSLRQGSRKLVMVFMAIGILILIFAVINYVNLTVAQTGLRAKEMATRRLLGSSRGELFFRLIMEATLICIISFLLGVMLAFAVLPSANDLLRVTIDLKGFFTIENSLLVLLMILMVGLISGLLPAIIISNSKPIDIVKGGFRTKTKMVFSKVFITFQNVITIMLLAASFTMFLQIRHMINAPLGYNTENIMTIWTHQFESREKIDAFANETRQLASVKRVAYSQGVPFSRGNNYTIDYEGRMLSFQSLVGDSIYFDMLGFKVIHRNGNISGNQCFLNEQALLETGLSPDATEIRFWPDVEPFKIAGIIHDFQLCNIITPQQPVIIQVQKDTDFQPWNVLIETQGDHTVVRNQIKEIYERITQFDFSESVGAYTDEMVKWSYTEQSRMAQLIAVFSIIAVIISLLGLLAMSTYFIQQRSREVAVRKVFGSSNKEVLKKLVFTFLNYVFIAFVIATPVIWYIMNQWISEYSYRIPLYPWIFISAGLFCLLIAFITVFFQSLYAANENPVNSIKTE